MKNTSEKKYSELQSKVDKLEKQLAKAKVELKACKAQYSQETKSRQNLEKQLKKSDDKYSALFEFSPSGIVLEDINGKILDANEAICKAFGYTREELIGMNVSSLAPAKNKSSVNKNLKDILAGESLCHQVENIRKDGSVCYNELYEKKIVLPGGEERILAIANDVTHRKKVEDFLKESERRYRALFETANDAIFLMDGSKFIDCNPKTLEMFGCTREDIINQSPFKFSPQKQSNGQSSKTKAVEKIKEAFSGKPQFFEWSHCRLDGSLFEAEVSLNRVELLQKNFVIAIVRDVTARKLNEKNLKESRENYKSLYNGVTAGIFRTTQEGVFINANESLVRILKYPDLDTLLNKRIQDIYFDTKHRDKWVEKLSKSNKNIEMETKFRCYDGTIIWGLTSTRAVKSAEGKILYFEGYALDITESKLAEGRLLESQKRYQALFNNSRDSIILENESGEILDVNQAGSNLFGYSREVMMGMYSSELTVDSKPFSKLVTKSKNANVIPNSIDIKTSAGRVIPIEISSADFNLGNQKLFITTARDISDRKRSEEKIRLYTNELKELNVHKDRLFSILAHDLKSPMTALIGFADLLEGDFDILSSEDIKECVRSIGQVSRNLNNLLENILEWSLLQKDKISFEPKMVNLNDEAETVIKLFNVFAEDKIIKIENHLDQTLLLNIDPNVLHTVLRNLISNAIKFSKNNSKVRLNSKLANETVEIIVEDNGIGMNQETLKKIFTNGVQSPAKGTRNETGTGLGLLICRELIEKSGGKIWAKSKKNKGSKFFMSFPLS